MRAIFHCSTCDFRLPYCVRTDRRFCGQRCRVWWYRHPGRKRPDFSPLYWDQPKRPGQGQPKTLAAALQALAVARQYAAQLEAAAQEQQREDRKLREKLRTLMDQAAESRAKVTSEQDGLRDDLEKARQQLAQAEQRVRDLTEQEKSLQKQNEEQVHRVQQAQDETTRLRAELDQAGRELAELRPLKAQREQHTQAISTLKSEASELKTARDELDRQNTALLRSRDELRGQLEKVQGEAAEHRSALERQSKDLLEVRAAQTQYIKKHAEEVATLKAQTTALLALRDDLTKQKAELTRDRDELRGRVEHAERTLAQRDDDLSLQHRNLAASERAHQEVHLVAESESRSLRAEKERRIAAEKRVEQLSLDLDKLVNKRQEETTDTEIMTLLLAKREELFTEELKEVRTHRDEAIAERELLAARILKLMAPGQYLEHAAAAGYDLTKDPLIRLKREEVLVENQLAAWQDAHKKRRRARRLDPEQTLDEQAYAAALAFRWKQINHPHLRRKRQPKWIAVGFLLDAESEKYLLTLTQERIEEMKRRVASP